MKKKTKIITGLIGSLVLLSLAGLAITGWKINWGPFSWLHSYDNEVSKIVEKYDVDKSQNGIIFYGASNFRLWYEMENDLSEYQVQNHGFGGSTDKDLVQYAPELLYSYQPKLVFFQTGSNDYVGLPGSDEEKVIACMEYKKEMFEQFHKELPNTKFVVMSGLLLPGRSEYLQITMQVNEELKNLCNQYDFMYFIDASDMTYDSEAFREELFESDGIHLNRDGQMQWCEQYIRPQIEILNIQ